MLTSGSVQPRPPASGITAESFMEGEPETKLSHFSLSLQPL